jgi:hypothetical protein
VGLADRSLPVTVAGAGELGRVELVVVDELDPAVLHVGDGVTTGLTAIGLAPTIAIPAVT